MRGEEWIRKNPDFDAMLRSAGWGSLIRTMRAGSGLSQFRLAEMLMTSQSVVSRLESAASVPTIRSLARVAAETGAFVSVSVEINEAAAVAIVDGAPYRRQRDENRRIMYLLAQARRRGLL